MSDNSVVIPDPIIDIGDGEPDALDYVFASLAFPAAVGCKASQGNIVAIGTSLVADVGRVIFCDRIARVITDTGIFSHSNHVETFLGLFVSTWALSLLLGHAIAREERYLREFPRG